MSVLVGELDPVGAGPEDVGDSVELVVAEDGGIRGKDVADALDGALEVGSSGLDEPVNETMNEQTEQRRHGGGEAFMEGGVGQFDAGGQFEHATQASEGAPLTRREAHDEDMNEGDDIHLAHSLEGLDVGGLLLKPLLWHGTGQHLYDFATIVLSHGPVLLL